MAALLFLVERRKKRELAERVQAVMLGAQGDPRKIEKATDKLIKDLAR